MSFEGHYQILCEHGHLSNHPYGYSSHDLDDWVCRSTINSKPCQSKIVKIENLVDDTNCESYGWRKPIEITPRTYVECNLGHSHVVNDPTYRLSDESYHYDEILDEYTPLNIETPLQEFTRKANSE